MTRMVPEAIHSSVKSDGERRVFQLIRDAASTETWVCLHSLGLARHEQKRRGEIDFLVLTPDGFFVLEVKGGGVERRNGRWVFTDRYGVRHSKAESPFSQASSAMFSLARDLREHFGPGSRLGNIFHGFGVMFPDVEFDMTGVESDPRQVYDRRSAAGGFTKWMRGLIEYTRSRDRVRRYALEKGDLEALVHFLRGDFQLIPTFATVAANVNQGLLRLTRQQTRCLLQSEQEPRLIVQGAAGTGKSLLAIETAVRAAKAGQSVLLLAYNQLLTAKLRAAAKAPLIEVAQAHGWMRDLVATSPDVSDSLGRSAVPSDSNDYFAHELPAHAALVQTSDRPHQFDLVIVDEAQDLLTEEFVDLLDGTVRGGLANGRWRLFLDANDQAAVYGRTDPKALKRVMDLAARQILPLNCRNTNEIDRATRVIAQPSFAAPASHPGESVERRWYANDGQLADEISVVISQLRTEGAPEGSVTFLYPSRAPQVLGRLERAGVRALTPPLVPQLGTEALRFMTHATTSAFKGLENDIIVLCGVDDIMSEWARSVTYVGMSRARVRLYVILSNRLREIVDSRFVEALRAELEDE
jgi:hypothetical protein